MNIRYDILREIGYSGYDEYYLQQSYDESQLTNEANIEIHRQLQQIDLELGTTETEQLYSCVCQTVRMDLIKVSFCLFQFKRNLLCRQSFKGQPRLELFRAGSG